MIIDYTGKDKKTLYSSIYFINQKNLNLNDHISNYDQKYIKELRIFFNDGTFINLALD